MAGYSLSIPAWEQTQLSSLGNQGLLSGVNPLILAGIDQAESSGSPGSPNSAGYGGYFGLSPTSKYPGGTVGSGEGQNNAVEFDKEAEIAASEFASLLTTYGGDVVHAEYAYQQGGNAPYPGDAAALATEGPSIVNQALGGTLSTGVPAPGGSISTPASGASAVTLKGFGSILQSLDSVMNPSGGSTLTQLLTLGGSDVVARVIGLTVRGMFTLGFIGVMYFGVKAVSSGGGSGSSGYPGKSVVDSIQNQQRIGQGNVRLGIQDRAQTTSEVRTGQAQTRLEQRTREEARKGELRRERKAAESAGQQGKHVKRGKHAAKSIESNALKDAFETVGEAAIVA